MLLVTLPDNSVSMVFADEAARGKADAVPDRPNVSMPMPEQVDNYIKNHEFHWLSKDRKLYTGKTHAAALIENKDLFGFTQQEIDYATDITV
ncbi:unnamed protein product, partial [marine sediment metagenome]